MSELDILFWLFILLLIGLGYAIEAGLANQHRRLLLSTMGSVTLASIYLMFAVEDTSSFDATRPAVQAEDEGEDGELGVFEFGGKKKKQKTASSSSPPSQSGAAKGPSEKERLKGPFSDCEGCPMMVPVQGRNFTLGSPLTEAGRADTEGPPRGVRVGDFTIGQYEVTREQYDMLAADIAKS